MSGKRWTTGEKVAAFLVGGAAVLYGAHRVLSSPWAGERQIFLGMRILGVHTQHPGEARPTDPPGGPGLTAEAGRRAMLASYDADVVDRWIRSGFAFWATDADAAKLARDLAAIRAAHPEDAADRARVLARVREMQAARGEK